jgi:diguanylate cyclase (GGDEF)-like protein/putative nucleotidyltransferase with HDIG domain
VSRPGTRLEAKRREQTPQAAARLAVAGLFIVMWWFLWALRIPMPVPFLIVLSVEVAFFLIYWRAVSFIPSVRGVQLAHAAMLASEIVFHTTMVYYLGGISWLGAFAYVFGLIFTNAFLDMKSGFVYTCGVAAAYAALAVLDATGTIPHYVYLEQGTLRYQDPTFLKTSLLGAVGVFFSIYAWSNWVGHQLRVERDTAVRAQDQLMAAHAELEHRVERRTAELASANASLSDSQQLLHATIESTADGILVVDSEGKAAFNNERFLKMWRIPQDVIDTRDDARLMKFVLDQLTDPDAFLAKVRDLYQTTLEDLDTLLFKDGRAFERFSRPLMRDGDPTGRVWSFRDVTENKKAEEVLRTQAQHDLLTATLNHASIIDVVRAASVGGAGAAPVAIAMVDVDGMKAVNDTYGHQAGDAVLVAVAAALAHQGALVGRYGGDEFLVALPGASRPAAEQYCRDVLKALSAAQVRDAFTGATIPVVASVGLAMYPAEAESIEEAIRLADNAMYTAKRERRNADGAPDTRNSLAEDRAAKMIGEIVPLLTSPGNVAEKLNLVAHRLSVGAGYDVVRFDTSRSGDDFALPTTFTRNMPEVTDEWNEESRNAPKSPFRDLLEQTRRSIIVNDLQQVDHFSDRQRELMQAVGLRAALIVPMMWQGEIIGVLSVATKSERSIDARDVQFLTAVATQVSAIIHMETMVDELQTAAARLVDARADTVILLAAAAEAHDQTTGRHLRRVRTITEALAREMGYSEDDIEGIGLGAVLHDIGKIRVPEAILLSPAQLGDEEWDLMKQHTKWGAEFLSERPGFELAASIAWAHHERWDGSGYPNGLAGDAIPEVATIVAVADSLDAMTNDRPYRSGRPLDWAVREIKRCSGQQFNPRVVDALLHLHERNAISLGADDAQEDARAA